MSGSVVIEKGRIRAAQDNLRNESCEFSQEFLNSLIDEIYKDYLEYDSDEEWNYMSRNVSKEGNWPVARIRLDNGDLGIGISVFIRTAVTSKRLSSLKPYGERTNSSDARMFHLALLEAIGMENPYLWENAWIAGDYVYPIQKENLKEVLLKNLEKVIKEES